MNKNFLKKVLKIIKRCFRGIYRIFFEKPVILYKIRGCPAINEFKLNEYYFEHKYNFLDYYPALLKNKVNKAKKIYKRVVEFDKNGIPMLKGFEQKYWPVTIIQYGLLNYNYYLTYKKEYYRKNVLKICDWLIDNISTQGAWEHLIKYHSNVTNEDILPPYSSAMVQGEAISLLVRGYFLNKKETYIECAGKAMLPYKIEVSKGGVLELINNMPFYEEYPTKTPSHVLNGFMFSLFGLYDLSQIDCSFSKEAKELFDSGVQTLIKVLPLYDGGFCSRYDLSYITAPPHNDNKNPFYHFIHVNQLIAINSVVNSEIIKFYIDEWK